MIHREDSGAVAVLRLEHGKANAIDVDLFADVNRALDDVCPPGGAHETERSAARALVLTGTGSMFSAGVNLFRVLEGGTPYLAEFLPVLSATVRRLFTFPLPVVAAINGHAIAGGCILAAACDRRIMNQEIGKIGVTELLVGVPFPVAAFETLRFLLPERHVQSLVYSGRTVGADEALEIGLVDEIVEADAVLDQACRLARRMAAIPADAFAITKRQIRQPALDRMQAQAAETDARVLEVWSRPEILDGIRAFLDKTVGNR